MSKLPRVLWALIFAGVATIIGKAGWDHFQEGVAAQHELVNSVVALTADNIGNVVKDQVPTVILTCTPDICAQIKPIAAELHAKYGDKVSVALLDAYANDGLWQFLTKVTAQSINKPVPGAFPAAFFLGRDAKPLGVMLGVHTTKEYEDVLDQVLATVTGPDLLLGPELDGSAAAPTQDGSADSEAQPPANAEHN